MVCVIIRVQQWEGIIHQTLKAKNGNWYNFNDTHTTEIKDLNNIISTQAYCLFYRKKK